MHRRRRILTLAILVLALTWAVVWVGHVAARHSRMTADKLRQYVRAVDFSRLQGDARAQALQALADKLNALPYEERRQARLNREWEPWFQAMTDAEKEQFVEATFPTGIKQMISAFEKMPDDRRRRAIDEAMRRLREAREEGVNTPGAFVGDRWRTNPPPELSPELEARIRNLGLRAFIANSSAQTKAEVAPLLEEIQRIVESGGRVGRRR